MVSVVMVTYGHEKFIKQALLSVLMQQVDFDVEVIVANDASPDNTDIIIKEIKAKHPKGDWIKYTRHAQNLGMAENSIFSLKQCKGKYIAFCEGDDYWSDDAKLQKQITFLENNPHIVLSSTRFEILDQEKQIMTKDGSGKLFKDGEFGFTFSVDYIFVHWVVKTLTVVFRRDAFDLMKVQCYKYFRDTHMFYHILENRLGYFHNFSSGVYRIHDKGVWSHLSDVDKVSVAYNVFDELFKKNRNINFLKNRYLQSINDLIEMKIVQTRFPLIRISIYVDLLNYFRQTFSFKFILFIIKRMIIKTFGQAKPRL